MRCLETLEKVLPGAALKLGMEYVLIILFSLLFLIISASDI